MPPGSKFFHFHTPFGKKFAKQECIPVGCILSAAVVVGGGCPVADPRGVPWHMPPYSPKFSQFQQFFRKFGKIICWCPPRRVGTPSYGESCIHPWCLPMGVCLPRGCVCLPMGGVCLGVCVCPEGVSVQAVRCVCLSSGGLPHTTPAQCMLGYLPPAQCMLGYTPPLTSACWDTPPGQNS